MRVWVVGMDGGEHVKGSIFDGHINQSRKPTFWMASSSLLASLILSSILSLPAASSTLGSSRVACSEAGGCRGR